MLELLGATLPELRRGLSEGAARTLAYELFDTYDRSYLSTASLRELEAALPAGCFLRIHRSYLVDLARVASVRRAGPDRLQLSLDDAQRTELDVARRQASRLRAALKLG